MSVIVRDEDGQILLLCKGADRSGSIFSFFTFLVKREKEDKKAQKKKVSSFLFFTVIDLYYNSTQNIQHYF